MSEGPGEVKHARKLDLGSYYYRWRSIICGGELMTRLSNRVIGTVARGACSMNML